MAIEQYFFNCKRRTILLLIFLLILTFLQDSYCMLQNFDDAKTELRTALGQPSDGPMSVITVARTPNTTDSTVLISHDEFEQVLRLLYPLCSGISAPTYSQFANSRRIPFWSSLPLVDRVRNFFHHTTLLNDDPSTLATTWPEDIAQVSNMCKDFKSLYDIHLKNSCNIIIFNEMFFSQVAPLIIEQKDFIRDKIFDLSKYSRHSLFYPNFLYIENREVTGTAIRNSFNTMVRNESSGIMDISYDLWCIDSCEQKTIINRGIIDTTTYNQDFLINETLGINDGTIVTKYKKSSYWNESNDSIRNGCLYEFGTGLDVGVDGYTDLCSAMLNNISIDICFDLACGIRANSNHWTNLGHPSRLHIVQSNSVDPFCDIPPNDNINRLPVDVPILYCDSYLDYHRNGLLYCQSNMGMREIGGNVASYRLYEIKIGDSVYTIGIYMR